MKNIKFSTNSFTTAKEWRDAAEKAMEEIEKTNSTNRPTNQDYAKRFGIDYSYVPPEVTSSNTFRIANFRHADIDGLVEIEELIDIDIVKIIKSGPATIVFFNDGAKIVVKRASDDEDSVYTAVAYAIAKKIYGNNSHFKKVVRDHLIEQDDKDSKNDSDPITHDILKDLFKDFKIGVATLKETNE